MTNIDFKKIAAEQKIRLAKDASLKAIIQDNSLQNYSTETATAHVDMLGIDGEITPTDRAVLIAVITLVENDWVRIEGVDLIKKVKEILGLYRAEHTLKASLLKLTGLGVLKRIKVKEKRKPPYFKYRVNYFFSL